MGDNLTTEIVKDYIFLVNQPLGEDLFKNKSQDKIAKVISEKIINDTGFKIIGIDGAWGSGKSNLVKLIETRLSSTHDFFIYDVWGHQEDEQRKAILVEITEFISSKENLLKKSTTDWNFKLKQLLANSKETITINQPYLSVGFIFSLLSIVYIPSVNVFKDSLADFFKIEELFWKLVLVLFPIFIVIFIYIYNFFRNWNKYGFSKSFKISAQETFQVYTNKQKEETKIETISDNQPSVRDFQKWMKEIDEDLNRKIVIVFDNFDRLPKKHILNIWSSIHIFFAEKNYSNIKVILPFDREHVQNAFKELNSNNEDKTFGDDYVNKTFDIVFRVTLPIMSDWKNFFENQWKNAFLKYEEDELKLVIQVYEFLNRRITPREIISFINEILTIKILDESFKERYIAIFILKKDEILKNPLKAVTELDYLKGLKSIYHNDSNFAKQLTAIIYHIEVEDALELIYTQELKDSLNKNDATQFNLICKSEFIDNIFTQAIIEIDIPENPIKTLSQLDEDTKLNQFNILQAWDNLYFKVLNNESNIDKLEIEEWQILLVKNHEDDRYLSRLLKKYSIILDETNTIEYVTLIDKIAERLDSDKVLNLLPEKKIKPQSFIELIENKDNTYKKYKLSCTEKEIDFYLSKLKIEDILKLKNTTILNIDFNLKEYKELLKTNLSLYIDQNNIEYSDNVLIKLKETSKTNGDLKNILDEGSIYSLYSNNSASNLPIITELIAMRIALGDKFVSYSQYFQTFLDVKDEILASKIALTLLNYIEYGNLLLASDFFKNSPLFIEIAHILTKDTSIHLRANVIDLIKNYDRIKSNIGIIDDIFLRQISRWKIDKENFEINDLNDGFVLDCFKYSHTEVSKLFIEKFNSEFKNLSQESYSSVFSDEKNIHFKYFENLKPDSLTQISLDTFQDYFCKKLKDDEVHIQWWKILKKYESNHDNLSILGILRTIRDGFLYSKIDITIEIAKGLIPYFIKYKILEAKTDVFRTIIKNTFLNDEEFISMLTESSDFIKSLYHNSPYDQKDGFRNAINEKRDNIHSIENLAKLLNIKKPKNNSPEKSS